MKRKNENIKCKICGLDTKVNGLAFHIKSKHSMGINEYISKYGEYRPKYIDYNNRAKETDVNCLICDNSFASERHLSFHIKKEHGLTKKEYIIQYILGGDIPKCKCGCGNEVRIKEKGSPPYYSDYISGHNTGDTHIGMKRSYESRMKMRKSAIRRMDEGNSVFYKGKSTNETELYTYIQSIYSNEIKTNDTEVLSGLELDIYLPDVNIAIELNGDRFHSDLYKTRLYHINKTKECQSQGIRLIHIWLCDWNSKRDILKSQLKNIVGQSDVKIGARSCSISVVSYEESKQFLTKNHLQGNSISKYRYGLYYNGELVQIMTFGKLRKATGRTHIDNSYELIRMVTKLNTTIVGGASRLFNHFIKTHSPQYILSFANRDWSVGNVYERMGMVMSGYTPPGYFYSNGNRREHRYNFQKHMLVKLGYDATKTEYQIMSERGYYRIWNTGNIIYEWRT
jgi:hypothetical protein